MSLAERDKEMPSPPLKRASIYRRSRERLILLWPESKQTLKAIHIRVQSQPVAMIDTSFSLSTLFNLILVGLTVSPLTPRRLPSRFVADCLFAGFKLKLAYNIIITTLPLPL